VLLLRVGGHLRAELAHHGLGARRGATSKKAGWPGKSTRLIGLGSSRAVVRDRRIHRAHRGAVVRIVAARGDGGSGGVSGRESV
jgi:hypothetical protein